MENFEPLISELRNVGGVTEVTREEEIIRKAGHFLLNPQESIASVERGLQSLEEHQGSIDRNCDLLEELFLKK